MSMEMTEEQFRVLEDWIEAVASETAARQVRANDEVDYLQRSKARQVFREAVGLPRLEPKR